MKNTDDHDLAYSKRREAAERQASVLATEPTAKIAHKALSLLYGDKVILARKVINDEYKW